MQMFAFIADTSEAFIQQPRVIGSLKGHQIVNIACGPMQSFAWTDVNNFTPLTEIPFVMDLCENTFKSVVSTLNFWIF